MHDFYTNRLPEHFAISLNLCVNNVHYYNTRLVSRKSYYLPKTEQTMANLTSGSMVLKSRIPLKMT